MSVDNIQDTADIDRATASAKLRIDTADASVDYICGRIIWREQGSACNDVSCETAMTGSLDEFQHYFEIVAAENGELIALSQRLRYQVYCIEHAFLNARDYPNELERDDYDQRSVHTVLRHRLTGLPAATVRLVLADESEPQRPFPIETCDILRRAIRDQAWRVPRHALGEISRFAVSKEFRRRMREARSSHGLHAVLNDDESKLATRRAPHIAVGLFKAICEMSVSQQVTHWYAVMEPALLRLLGQLGIEFTTVGPLVDYHGLRQPCIAVGEDVLAGLRRCRPEIWAFVTDDGRLSLQ